MRHPLAAIALLAATPLLAVPGSAATAPAQQKPAAPQIIVGEAEKVDMGCLVGLTGAFINLQKEGPDSQTKAANALNMVAYFTGKIAARHPGKKALDVVDQSNVTQAEIEKSDADKCLADFKGAFGE